MKFLKQLFHNLILARQLEKEYNIPIIWNWWMYNYESCVLVSEKATGKSLYIHIKCSVWFSKQFNIIVHHELGHHLHPDGKHEIDIVAELAAWEWAFTNSPDCLTQDIGEAHSALATYWADPEADLSPEQRQEAFETLNKIIIQRICK